MTARAPIAPRHDHRFEIHGDTRTDDYSWLRDKNDPEVRAYLNAENTWTDRFMAPTASLQNTIFTEIKARTKETDISVPYRIGAWLYYSRTEEGKPYPTYYRKGAEDKGPEMVTLDVNELARGHDFMAVGAQKISPDGNLLAYTTDDTGFRRYTLNIKNLIDGQLGPEAIERVTSAAWANDNKTLFYVVEDDAKRPYRLYRHVLGTDGDDVLVYEETDERFRVNTWRTLSDAFLVLELESHTTTELRFVDANRPDAEFVMLAARRQNHEYSMSHRGDVFYIRTNDKGRNFRVVTAPVSNPGRANWKEMIAHRDDVMIQSARVFADFCVVVERNEGLARLRFITDDRDDYLELPETVYAVWQGVNAVFDTDKFRFHYQSMVTPPSVFDYDVASRERILLKQTEVLGGYDKTRYKTERIFATATDGTRVPISLVCDKDVPLDGTAPLHLTGYGSYGASYPARFSVARLSLLDRGVIHAIAHVRGGGEMGKRWHDNGRLFHKKNTFTDFVSCAEHLIERGYTSASRLVASGGSAGGLLMGAILNSRPNLWKLVILHVPFVDVINTMLDETLPLTVGEFEEWGNPKDEAAYDYMLGYCPYSNLRAHAYPAILVKTSFNDSQVMYWEPAKFVARLRTLKTNDTPLLLKTNMTGGHGGSSGRYDAWRETAFDYALLLRMVGR